MSTNKLPEDFWDTIEKHLPGYYHRDDVLLNELMQKYMDGELESQSDIELVTKGCPPGMPEDAWVASKLAESNQKLYDEACAPR